MKSQEIVSTHREGVSIIIPPTQNYGDLSRLLQTFTDKNSYHPLELIIAAPEDTKQFNNAIDQFKLKYFIMPVKHLVKEKAAFLNRAAAEAVYPNLLFINSAIIYTDNILPLALRKLNNPLIGLVGIRLNEFNTKDPNGDKILQAGITVRWNNRKEQFEPVPVSRKHLSAAEYYKNRNYLAVNSSFLLCRKKDYLNVGGFNEKLEPGLADLEFCLRLQTELKKVCYCLNEKCLHLPCSEISDEMYLKNKPDNINSQPKKLDANKKPDSNNVISKLSGKIAVVAHVYYFEQWAYLARLIKNIPFQFQLYVTMPENSKLSDQKTITDYFPDAKIILHPNLGRDIAPFLEVLPTIAENDYELVCKVHTKKDDPIYGDAWRRLMLQSTLGKEDLVRLILEKFTENPDLGMVGPLQLYKSGRSLMYDNLANIKKIRQFIPEKQPLPADWGFFPGSCFWARPDALLPLAKAVRQLIYEDDNTKSDGQLAHAIERLFGLAIMEAGKIIGLVSSPPGKNSKFEMKVIKPPGNPSSEYVEQTIPFYIRQNLTGYQPEVKSL